MDLNKPVSGREFARMVGQTEGAVRKAVERQSILKGKNLEGKYIPEIASLEWGKPILPEYLQSSILVIEKKPLKEKLEKKAIVKPDKILKEKITKVIKKEIEVEPELPFSDDSPKHVAERKSAIYRARMAELEYNEKQGNLIHKSKISNILFGYGQQIRIEFESLKNIILDKVRAVDTRNEAEIIFDEQVYIILNKLSEIENKKF